MVQPKRIVSNQSRFITLPYNIDYYWLFSIAAFRLILLVSVFIRILANFDTQNLYKLYYIHAYKFLYRFTKKIYIKIHEKYTHKSVDTRILAVYNISEDKE